MRDRDPLIRLSSSHCIQVFLPHDLEARDGSRVKLTTTAEASAESKRLSEALHRLSAEESCDGHFVLSGLDDESYWNYRDFSAV